MESGEKQRDKLRFKHLPGFCSFLLKEKLEEFVRVSFRFSAEEELPLMKLFASVPEETLMESGKAGVRDMLEAIASNSVGKYIDAALEKWKDDALGRIGKTSISTQDITNGAFVRRKIFRHFLNDYTSDTQTSLLIMEEVDRFTTHTELMSYEAYVQIQKEELEKANAELLHRESQLLEAQELGEMGSFLWELNDPAKSEYTPQLLKIFGMQEGSKLEAFIEFVHPGDRTMLGDVIEKALKERSPFECEYRYLRKGEIIHIYTKGVTEFDAENRPVRMKGTIRDNTRKHRMLQQLNVLNDTLQQKNAELERSYKELESFSYIASHDLQEPLRKIRMFSTRLLEKAQGLPDDIRDYLQRMSASSERMKNLIEDLLAFSRATSPVDAFEPVSLDQILAEAKQTLSVGIDRTQARIEAAPLPELHAVPFQLSQLFVNLISNSIKYRKENETPEIRISVAKVSAANVGGKENEPGEFLRITFSDNGIGFENEYNERIFELFQRLHPKEKYSGTGIGLAICKKIVQNHGGVIHAEAEPGKGASFHIYLPAERIITNNKAR